MNLCVRWFARVWYIKRKKTTVTFRRAVLLFVFLLSLWYYFCNEKEEKGWYDKSQISPLTYSTFVVFHQLSFSKKRFDHHERGKKNPLTFATAILSLPLSSENTKALRVVLSSFQSAYKVVKVAKLHTKWCSSFFLFRGVERRVKNTRTNKKSSFLLKKKKEESKFFTQTLLERVSVSLCLFRE